jgi:hypothetical protein
MRKPGWETGLDAVALVEAAAVEEEWPPSGEDWRVLLDQCDQPAVISALVAILLGEWERVECGSGMRGYREHRLAHYRQVALAAAGGTG